MESTTTSQFKGFADLVKGERYTILFLNELGFGANSVQFTHEESKFRSYAQYTDALQLVMKPKGKRQLRQMWFYGNKEFVVWKDWVRLDTDFLGASTDEGPFTVRKSKYASFDKRYLRDAIRSTPLKPLFSSVTVHEALDTVS